MPIDPGKMRHRVTFQSFTGAVDSFGDPQYDYDSQWTDVATVWAAIDPVSGKEAQQSQSEVTHKVRCRYRPGLTTAMRIKYGSRLFKIISILDWEERHESLLIMCTEVVP